MVNATGAEALSGIPREISIEDRQKLEVYSAFKLAATA
jgi:hypothetical protein